MIYATKLLFINVMQYYILKYYLLLKLASHLVRTGTMQWK